MSHEIQSSSTYQNVIDSLETVLSKFSEVDSRVFTLQEGLQNVIEGLSQSRRQIEETKGSLQTLESEKAEATQIRSMVSSTLDDMFREMSRIVDSARENLREHAEHSTEHVQIFEEPLPTMNEVHETLREVAKTLLEEENAVEEVDSSAENEPLSEPEAVELNGELPISSEPPTLLRETLAKTGILADMESDIEEEDFDDEVADPEEVSELLKSISSSYVAGTPESKSMN